MDQPEKASAINADPDKGEMPSRLASEAVLFLHAGGVPIDSLTRQLSALRCFGEPNAHFDLDGPMLSAMNGTGVSDFARYLVSLIDWTAHDAGRLSALIDYRDLLWLEQRPIFKEQLHQRLRVVRLAFLDPALQAYRRLKTVQALNPSPGDTDGEPGFARLARELIEVEEAEQIGDDFCKRHGLPLVKLWVEDLARPGVPALCGLLNRWSIQMPDGGQIVPIDPPAHAELEIVAAFRAEADRRHWSHALLPDR